MVIRLSNIAAVLAISSCLLGCGNSMTEIKDEASASPSAAATAYAPAAPTMTAVPSETAIPVPEEKNITICLDPGHQAPDITNNDMEPIAPGSSEMKLKVVSGTSGRYTGVPEYQLNLTIALAVRDKLCADGYNVVMTREDNETYVSNIDRANIATDNGANFCVRIHANGAENPDANGALALISTPSNPWVGSFYTQSLALAQDVLNAYCASTGMVNTGISEVDNMTGINWSTMPVMILEMGFMTNETDDRNMENPTYQQNMINGIVQGIETYAEGIGQ